MKKNDKSNDQKFTIEAQIQSFGSFSLADPNIPPIPLPPGKRLELLEDLAGARGRNAESLGDGNGITEEKP
jgi:hypothetical protein